MNKEYDVIVCGGGPGGIAASIGAARAGLEVLLIERYGFLGGGATAMLVNPFMTYFAGEKQIIQGVFQDLIDLLIEMGAYGNQNMVETPWAFDAEAFKVAAEQLCKEEGVEILYHSFLTGVKIKGDLIDSIQIATKDGLKSLTARIYVDATGDGDLSCWAGALVEKGRTKDNLTQPMTLNFRMGNVNLEKMPSRKEITSKYIKAKKNGELECPREDILFFFTTQPGVVHFNQTRVVQYEATDSCSLSDAETEGRRQAWEISQWLIDNISGFENAYLQQTAPQIGVRESRRIIGEYKLTADDILNGCKFKDAIACGSYPIDIHNPKGEGTELKYLEEGDWYNIPYRSIVPLRINNLLVAARSISCTHKAHSSVRVMPIVFAIGHAAGVAAALSVTSDQFPRKIDYQLVQTELLEQGAFLGD